MILDNLHRDRSKILLEAEKLFLNSSSLILKIGCELEFFLLQKNHSVIDDKVFLLNSIFELKAELTKNFSLIYDVEKERGASQIEIKTKFTSDLLKLATEIAGVRDFVKDFALRHGLIASFLAQPFVDDCGSAMQFNISLHDNESLNIFKSDEMLAQRVGEFLLEATDSMLLLLAPNESDYLRFSPQINRDLFKNGKFSAPINLSIGGDNRTCAIRIPKGGNRLEYRVACAASDPFLCLAAIVISISLRIARKDLFTKCSWQKIHGNAFEEKYLLKPLIQSIEQARGVFLSEENEIRKIINSWLS